MKSILRQLQEKTKTSLASKHQFHNESLEFREYYAAVILLQTQLSDAVTPTDNFELLRLFTYGLHLGREEVRTVIRFAQNKEQVLEHVLAMLLTEEQQTVFLLDLYNLSYTGCDYGEKELQAVAIYGELFHIPSVNLKLFQQLIREVHAGNVDECMKIYANLQQVRIPCSMDMLRYYMPELEYMTVLNGAQFYPGGTVEINGQCEIREPLTIPLGCTVKLNNASVVLLAPLILEGASLEVSDSVLEHINGTYEYMIEVKSQSHVKIRNSHFYCHNHCGAVKVNGSQAEIKGSAFYESNARGAVRASNSELVFSHDTFQDCYSQSRGGALHVMQSKGMIAHCSFQHCLAISGGAVLAQMPVVIRDCVFTQCHANEFGHSIYYIGYGQDTIKRCVYGRCREEQKQCVQEITAKELSASMTTNEWMISTYLIQGGALSYPQSIYMHDMALYLASPLRIPNGISMENCHIEVRGHIKKDMIDVTNASRVEIKNCTFDGMEQASGLKATGTRLVIQDCLFKNMQNGRAIYNSVDLSLEDVVFCNCLDGAVYGSRALIKRCQFINCRSNVGAGVYLAGNKGFVKNCAFHRCVAKMSGGGISTFGNYQIEQCTYTQCAPDDRG